MKKTIREIEAMEHKRERSQAALVTAILKNSAPNDTDVDFFNMYTNRINTLRNRYAECQRMLNEQKK